MATTEVETLEKKPEEKDELEALDALEKEASEFNKVRLSLLPYLYLLLTLIPRTQKSTVSSKPSN